MSTVTLKNINKIYDNNVQAVFDFNLDIKEHEFIVLVGPSGCGKSTTLRMIAGLEEISDGDLYIDDVLCNDIAPKNRDIAMVFQNYALYPHMTVYENMAFGLKNKSGQNFIPDFAKVKSLKSEKNKLVRKNASREEIDNIEKEIDKLLNDPSTYIEHNGMLPKDEIDRRINEAAEILNIKEYLGRKPKALSGGQCQRVALGRAIVRHAKVFLMDEPLSNLDAKLRVSMRGSIIRLHKRIGAITIYVTHDQTEAMTMADRIVVMNKGYIQQIGDPKEIYNHPKNVFVAGFIGSPSMNFINAHYDHGTVTFGNSCKIRLSLDQISVHDNFYKKEIAKNNKKIDEVRKIILNDFKKYPESYLADIPEEERKNYSPDIEKYKDVMEARKNIAYYESCLNTKEHDIIIGIRPEDIVFAKTGGFKAEVDVVELLGHNQIVHLNLDGVNDIQAEISSKINIVEGSKVMINFDEYFLHIFDKESELALF